MKGSDAFLQTLIKQGTDITFGYPGATVIPIFDKYLEYSDKIKNILVRHEQCAAHAAEGYAKASGNVGVCISTSGPGATNLLTGIMDAYMDNIPIIAISGQVSTNLIANDAFQECDMIGMTMPITKHNFQIRDPNEMASTLLKAYKIATEGRPGPVFIDLPKDAQTGDVTKEIPNNIKIHSFQPTIKGNILQIKKAAELILNAERPVILAGGGVIYSGASNELRELVETTMIPVITSMHGKGAIDERHPLCLGMLGMHGRKIANYACDESDLIINIGCRLNDRVTGNLARFAEKAKVVHIDIDPAEIGKNVKVDLPIVGDAKHILIDLITSLKHYIQKGKIRSEETEWQKRTNTFKKECNCDDTSDSTPVKPIRIIKELNKLLNPKDIVTTGVGQHQMFAMHFLRMQNPRTFISSGGAGTMGFGLPSAIGAKFAKPDVNVFDIDGDGSFQMTMQELGTCKEEGIKVMPIIFRNNYLGMVRQWLQLFLDKRYSQVNLSKNQPDFVKIANAYGLNGIKIERSSDVNPALQDAIKSDETFLIEISIPEESNILPMLSPGGGFKDTIGHCMKSSGRFF